MRPKHTLNGGEFYYTLLTLVAGRRVSEMNTPKSDNNSILDPHSQTQTASVRFFLTEPEYNEAVIARGSLWRTNRLYRIAGRVICDFVICFFIVAPSWVGDSWSHLLKTDPVLTIGLCGFAALWLYCALGMPWIEPLNRRFNRFDLEREITIAPDGVRIARGEKAWKKKWSEFACYYETAVLYVLQTRGFEFWTIPKRAFETGIDRSFHEILDSNLRRKNTKARDNPKSASA